MIPGQFLVIFARHLFFRWLFRGCLETYANIKMGRVEAVDIKETDTYYLDTNKDVINMDGGGERAKCCSLYYTGRSTLSP